MHTIKDNQQLSEKQDAKHVGLLYQLNYIWTGTYKITFSIHNKATNCSHVLETETGYLDLSNVCIIKYIIKVLQPYEKKNHIALHQTGDPIFVI